MQENTGNHTRNDWTKNGHAEKVTQPRMKPSKGKDEKNNNDKAEYADLFGKNLNLL